MTTCDFVSCKKRGGEKNGKKKKMDRKREETGKIHERKDEEKTSLLFILH